MNRFLDKLEIQPDSPCLNIASAPPGFHLFHAPLGYLHSNDFFPFSDQGSNLLLESPAIPSSQYALALRGIATGPHVEIHCLVVANDHPRRAFAINHLDEGMVRLL